MLIDPETLLPDWFPRAFHVDAQTRALVTPLFDGADWEEPGLPAGYCLPRTWATTRLPVGAILLPKGYGHPIPTLMQQSISAAALAVLNHTSTLEHEPRLALQTAARLTAQAPAFVLYSGDLPTTVAMIASTVNTIIERAAEPDA